MTKTENIQGLNVSFTKIDNGMVLIHSLSKDEKLVRSAAAALKKGKTITNVKVEKISGIISKRRGPIPTKWSLTAEDNK